MNPLFSQGRAYFLGQSVLLAFPAPAGSPVTSNLLCHPDVLCQLQIPGAVWLHYIFGEFAGLGRGC